MSSKLGHCLSADVKTKSRSSGSEKILAIQLWVSLKNQLLWNTMNIPTFNIYHNFSDTQNCHSSRRSKINPLCQEMCTFLVVFFKPLFPYVQCLLHEVQDNFDSMQDHASPLQVYIPAFWTLICYSIRVMMLSIGVTENLTRVKNFWMNNNQKLIFNTMCEVE